LGTVFIIACFFIFIHGDYGFSGSPAPGAWFLAFTAAFGYAVGWNPFAADYTRYMSPNSDRKMVGVWAGLGVFVSCIVLELAGAVLSTVTGTKWGTNDIPTAQLQRAMPDLVYYPTLICIALGAVAANAINIYSGTMSLVALGIREMGLSLRQRRAMLAILAGVIGYFGGLVLESRGVASQYTNFLLLISYWIAPWLAVMFTDFWLRRGDYGDESMFYDTNYRRWQGFVAMAVGLVVSIGLFANVFGLYVAPIPTSYPQIGDVTFIVGFVITAVLYYVLDLGLRKQPAVTPGAGSRAG
jgi:NCS1 family nucleobase:cation symporter-1